MAFKQLIITTRLHIYKRITENFWLLEFVHSFDQERVYGISIEMLGENGSNSLWPILKGEQRINKIKTKHLLVRSNVCTVHAHAASRMCFVFDFYRIF